jgi:hypothetical protein
MLSKTHLLSLTTILSRKLPSDTDSKLSRVDDSNEVDDVTVDFSSSINLKNISVHASVAQLTPLVSGSEDSETEIDSHAFSPWIESKNSSAEEEKRGTLVCDGVQVDSEIIFWKSVPGDDTYESPITPHHGLHHDRYLSFEYDNGGWNNVSKSLITLKQLC